jgi:hypothetical protein
MTTTYHFSAIALLTLVTLIAGCGGGSSTLKTYRVEGTVTHNGQPVADASLTFYPIGGQHPGYAKTDTHGKYKLSTTAGAVEAGTVPGEYTVTVSKQIIVPTGKKVRGADGGEYNEETTKETLPLKYTTVQNTPFKVTVEAKRLNEMNFALE